MMPTRFCACGCGREIDHKRAGARTFDAACRKRLSRGARGEWAGPTQAPTLPNALVEAVERRLLERADIERMIEADDTLIGRHLNGRVGTSMRGSGGILPWAQPLHQDHRRRRDAQELRKHA